MQAFYTAGQSKADLLHLLTDLTVAGDDEEVLVLERPSFDPAFHACRYLKQPRGRTMADRPDEEERERTEAEEVRQAVEEAKTFSEAMIELGHPAW